jgi:hypothetical protein
VSEAAMCIAWSVGITLQLIGFADLSFAFMSSHVYKL